MSSATFAIGAMMDVLIAGPAIILNPWNRATMVIKSVITVRKNVNVANVEHVVR